MAHMMDELAQLTGAGGMSPEDAFMREAWGGQFGPQQQAPPSPFGQTPGQGGDEDLMQFLMPLMAMTEKRKESATAREVRRSETDIAAQLQRAQMESAEQGQRAVLASKEEIAGQEQEIDWERLWTEHQRGQERGEFQEDVLKEKIRAATQPAPATSGTLREALPYFQSMRENTRKALLNKDFTSPEDAMDNLAQVEKLAEALGMGGISELRRLYDLNYTGAATQPSTAPTAAPRKFEFETHRYPWSPPYPHPHPR